MKYFLMVTLLIFMVENEALAGFADNIAKMIFQKKVEELYDKALLCSPLERDLKSSMNVTDWMKIQPTIPEWSRLAEIESTAKEARLYAQSLSRQDKNRHCLAGCYIAKKLDYPSAVLVGWLKELSDASDCKTNTSFEKKDHEATVFGARAWESEKECESFCKSYK